ncbi:hypothetical protein B0H11DRAFT_2303125 [Mycena galericulata]|nr:hypothetical protein B0H11DRAFT_2303125 [Mycena galericulata]
MPTPTNGPSLSAVNPDNEVEATDPVLRVAPNLGPTATAHYLPNGNDWPEKVQRAFDIIPGLQSSHRQRASYGPWDKLLHHAFPGDSDWIITPGPVNSASVEFICSLDIHIRGHTSLGIRALAVELRPGDDIGHASAHRDADNKMRRRLGDLRAYNALDVVYGLSVFGTRFCVYTMTGMEIVPVFPRDQQEMWANIPKNDVSTPDGRRAVVELFQAVKFNVEKYLENEDVPSEISVSGA